MKYKIRKKGTQDVILILVVWIDEDRQWVTMDNLRLHDSFLVTRFALENCLTNEPGWTWTKDYVGKLPIIHQAYKVSRFMKTIKFGIEDPQYTKKAFEMDHVEGNNLGESPCR